MIDKNLKLVQAIAEIEKNYFLHNHNPNTFYTLQSLLRDEFFTPNPNTNKDAHEIALAILEETLSPISDPLLQLIIATSLRFAACSAFAEAALKNILENNNSQFSLNCSIFVVHKLFFASLLPLLHFAKLASPDMQMLQLNKADVTYH